MKKLSLSKQQSSLKSQCDARCGVVLYAAECSFRRKANTLFSLAQKR